MTATTRTPKNTRTAVESPSAAASRYQQLRSHLAELKLHAAAEALPAVLDQASAEGLSLTTALERLLASYQTGVSYMVYHLLALFVVVLALGRWPASSLPVWSGWLFVAGILLFSGSLIGMAFTGQRWLGAITPIGGVAWIVGWLLLAAAAWRG